MVMCLVCTFCVGDLLVFFFFFVFFLYDGHLVFGVCFM